jgi:hypothetical protein
MSVIDTLLSESVRAASRHGMEISNGVLCLPAGLNPERVRRLTSALRGVRFDRSDPAMMWFMELAGVRSELRDFIDCFIDEGTLDFIAGFERLNWRQKLKIGILGYQALGVFDQLRDYIARNLDPAVPGLRTLEEAVVVLRDQIVARMGCASDWDAILQPNRETILIELGTQWQVHA